MTPAPYLEDASIESLREALTAEKTESLIVRLGRDAFGVVTAMGLAELEISGRAGRASGVEQLARAAPIVHTLHGVAAMRRALEGAPTGAVVVLDHETNRPVGVVTQAALALAFLDVKARTAVGGAA